MLMKLTSGSLDFENLEFQTVVGCLFIVSTFNFTYYICTLFINIQAFIVGKMPNMHMGNTQVLFNAPILFTYLYFSNIILI